MILKGLLNFSDVAGKPRFVAGRRILMDKAFIDGLVDQRNCRTQRFGAHLFIAVGDRASQTFDLGPKFAAIAAVDRIPFRRLSNSLFCRFMICHYPI
jgi:hypothetical protein